MTWPEYGCVPQPGVFGHLSAAGSPAPGDCGTFKRQVLGGRSKVLRTCLLGLHPSSASYPLFSWPASLSEPNMLSYMQGSKASSPGGWNRETRSHADPPSLGLLPSGLVSSCGEKLQIHGASDWGCNAVIGCIFVCLRHYSLQRYHFSILTVLLFNRNKSSS